MTHLGTAHPNFITRLQAVHNRAYQARIILSHIQHQAWCIVLSYDGVRPLFVIAIFCCCLSLK